jgi:hypothetical protein
MAAKKKTAKRRSVIGWIDDRFITHHGERKPPGKKVIGWIDDMDRAHYIADTPPPRGAR